MKKSYRVIGKFHIGKPGEIIELEEVEGDGFTALGKLEKVVKKASTSSTSKTARKPRTKKVTNDD